MQQRSGRTDAVLNSLVYRYAREPDEAPNVSTEQLQQKLQDITPGQLGQHGSFLNVLFHGQPEARLTDVDFAVLSSVDDCLKIIDAITNLDPAIRSQIQLALPLVASSLISDPGLPLSKNATPLTIVDAVTTGAIGWSENLGRGSEILLATVTMTIDQLLQPEADAEAIQAEFDTFLTNEQSRVDKLEERLAASETGQLRSQESKNIAGNMINQATQGQMLTTEIVAFLQGAWFDSMQLLVLQHGDDSAEWQRATKLTETIVWTYQPIEDDDGDQQQRLYRIIESLPGEISELMVSLEYEPESAESALEVIESDHVILVSGGTLDYTEYTPIDCPEPLSIRSKVSRVLLRRVSALEVGQWFLFVPEEGKSMRMKLVLKLDDVKQLLFTNRSGMKVMHSNFGEFAYLMSSGAARALHHQRVFSQTFKFFYEGLMEEHKKHLKVAAQRRAETEQIEQERESARQKALTEAADLAVQQEEAERNRVESAHDRRLHMASQEAAKSENQDLVTELTIQVESLAVGAWLRLPGKTGELEECKLAVRIARADKMIFVTRAGVKIGEYSIEQLVQLIVAGECEIEDQGVEFEDTLAQVVSKLRLDRKKSYDDLTGQ
jgi:hypothetical protein